jgi:hypothetical protein
MISGALNKETYYRRSKSVGLCHLPVGDKCLVLLAQRERLAEPVKVR